MGKQINYWMEYESFLVISEAALEKGCVIFKQHNGKTVQAKDLSIITNDCWRYFFHLPIAGDVETRTLEDGREVINCGYSSTGNAIIEAGFSNIYQKQIMRNRLFSINGYYTDGEEWIPRPDCMTDLYNSLVRKVKIIAPYIELSDIETYKSRKHRGEKFERKHKEYITAHCLELREKGYALC